MQNPPAQIDYQKIGSEKKDYFLAGHTLTYAFRIKQLKALKAAIKQYEPELLEAIYKDLHKPAFEAFTHEVGFIYKEINHTISELRNWMKPREKKTELELQPASSKVYIEPKGVVLIFGPFNFPFQLLFGPLVGAIAAGNCMVLKPSELASHTEKITQRIITSAFNSDYCEVVTGPGDIIGPALQKNIDFDHVFFTGSPVVGKIVMKLAAEKLTPVSLELGGKSPAIIHTSARVDHAVRKIMWGKTINSGQSCVAPDYVLLHKNQLDEFVKSWKKQKLAMFGSDPQKSPDYGRIINTNRFKAVTSLMEGLAILDGGKVDEQDLYIEPTLIGGAGLEDKIMQTEIFGPLLPVLTYENEAEILPILRRNPDPLACYIFTTVYQFESYICKHFAFGGGSVNNTMSHLGVSDLPFGGRGTSGIGAYHGEAGFLEFSHKKAMLKMPSIIDVSTLYPPFSSWKYKLSRFFLK